MYKIVFYQNTKDENEVLTYINYLNQHNNKDSRIKLKKITAYMRLLQTNGLALGEPYIKHLCDNMQNTWKRRIKKMNKEVTWNDIEKSLNFTPEEESAIQLEVDLIQATINAREKSNLSQRDLSKICGLKQPVIARIESRARSPKVETLLKMLLPMGYTLKVMPIDRHITKK